MDEDKTVELTDDEIANANTVIIVDSEGTQPIDSVNEELQLEYAAREERNRDSQLTYLSNDSMTNNVEENISFRLSGMSDELESIDHSRSQNDADGISITPGCVAVPTSSDVSPVVDKKFPSGPLHLSSTPLLHSTFGRKEINIDKIDSGEFSGEITCSLSPSRRRRLSHHSSSDEHINTAKRLKNMDDSHQMNLTDEKNELEIQEHTFALVGSATLLIDKSNNTIYAAHLKQLSLAEELEDSSSGRAVTPNGADCAIRHRLSMGSGSDSSGNLADRSLTASSGFSVPGPFEWPPSHRRPNREGSSHPNHRDSLTSTTSSSLTSISRQNGLRYLDTWFSKHLMNDHHPHNSLLKLFHTQHIQLSCPGCNHIFPPLEVPPVMESQAAGSSNVTPDVMSVNDPKRPDGNVITQKNKVPVVDQEMVPEDSGSSSMKALSAICYLNKSKKHKEIIQSKNPSNQEKKIYNSSANGESLDSLCQIGLPVQSSHTLVHSQGGQYLPKAGPSGQNKRILNYKTENSDNSTNSTSDCDILADDVINSPFIDGEDIITLMEGVKGKLGPKHLTKQTRVPPVEENDTILFNKDLELSSLPNDCRLFQNCNFLFTHSGINWKRKQYDPSVKSSSEEESSGNESVSELNSVVSDIINEVKRGGGSVYKSLQEVPLAEWGCTYLIASHPCRTVTYLQCLAAGISRYGPICLLQCSDQRKPIKKFLADNFGQLPSGWSEELKRDVLSQKCLDPLQGLQVLLALSKGNHRTNEINFWEGLLTNMAASVIRYKGGLEISCLYAVNIIIADSNCSDLLIEVATKASIPIVSCNWIIHTLIHGEYRDPTASPTYKHTYVP